MLLNKIKQYSTIILIGIIIILSIFIYFKSKKIDNLESQNNLEEAYNDSIIKKYDKDLKSIVSSKELLESDNKNLTKFLKEKDKELYFLLKKKDAITAIITKDSIKLDTIVKHNTIIVKDGKFLLKDTISNSNYLAIIKANQDSTQLSLKAFNTRKIFLTRVKNKTILNVADSNPIIINQDLKGFIIKDKPKNGKFITGLIIGAAGAYFILK